MAADGTPDPRLLAAAMDEIAIGRAAAAGRPLVLGLCGAQGSGKSTLAAAIVARCEAQGIRAAILSLDDLYLGKTDRAGLARTVHPLLVTRGVPGTHDVPLGLEVLEAIDRGGPVRLPRFDKAIDDRLPPSVWPLLQGPLEVLVFEGWCVGARPQHEAALGSPVNLLEATEDTDGRWRRHVNQALAEPYRQLFDRIDRLMLLAAPGFKVVEGWRCQQEDVLARRRPRAGRVLGRAELARFVSHYERLTRHILAEMPCRADCTVRLSGERRVIGIELRRPPPAPG